MITYLPNWKFFRIVDNQIVRDVTPEEELTYYKTNINKLKDFPWKRFHVYDLFLKSFDKHREDMIDKAKGIITNDRHIYELCNRALKHNRKLGRKIVKSFWIDYVKAKEENLLIEVANKRYKKKKLSTS